MIRLVLFVTAIILGIGAMPTAKAETGDDFINRIKAAYAASDRALALKALFFLEGMDPETQQMYESRVIGRILKQYDAPAVSLEPLPADYQPVQVGGGYEYRPNLRPLGYVVLNAKTRILYGLHGSQYYFAGIARTPIVNPLGPERTMQMIAVGFGDPQIKFDGHCDVLLANRSVRRVRLDDEGLTSKTMLLAGVRIEACELHNLSDRGAVMLRLLEGDDQIFDRQVDYPETVVSFTR